MNFFIMSYDTSINKSYPQVHKIRKGYDLSSSANIYDYIRFNDGIVPPFTPDLGCFEVHPKITLSDFVSCTFTCSDLLISKKAYEIIAKLNPMRYIKYETCIYRKTEVLNDFYLFHFLYDDNFAEGIDFKKSNFNWMFSKEKVRVESLEHFRTYCDYGKYGDILIYTKIAINNKFDLNIDLFILPYGGVQVYVSEFFVEAYISAGLTGMIFEPANQVLLLP